MHLYHGTSSNKAHKIINMGFRPGNDGAVFFAEDELTAHFFAQTTKIAPNETPPRNFTIIVFDVPNDIVRGLFTRDLIGRFRDAPPIQIDATSSQFELILIGPDKIKHFNQLFLVNKTISFQRWRIV